MSKPVESIDNESTLVVPGMGLRKRVGATVNEYEVSLGDRKLL